jgi:hypothetical protein
MTNNEIHVSGLSKIWINAGGYFEFSCGQSIRMKKTRPRPYGVIALGVFFFLGAIICLIASLSLAFPNSFMQPMWRLNPRGHEGLVAIGRWAVLLLSTVGVFCAAAAIGLWRGNRWGHGIAIALIAINLIADVINTLLGTEPRAIVGVPIAVAILWYLLSKRVRAFYQS